ncbi:MAG: hypothetical protein K6F21_02185 [Bacteroidales bacterium]|nr:hypothetical protein [Bacteroidales bacterium]
MKYLVRSFKYFAYLAIMLCIFIVLLSLFGLVGSSVDDIFRDGANSLWKIAGIIAVFALIYPRLGFGTRNALVPGSYEEIRSGVVDVMHNRGYVLESEKGEDLTFRLQSPVMRVTRMFEDRITFTRTGTGFELEGPVKDLVRIASALESRFRPE